MEQDSFEHNQVAEALRGRFIAIKVDREERPDVDSIYMDALVGLSGHGGWPMSVFLTPDLKPFWGGTYFPRAQLLKILDSLSKAWHEDRSNISVIASQIADALSDRNQRQFEGRIDVEIFNKAASNLSASYDAEFGGFGGAPKFPPAEQCRFLLRYGWRTQDQRMVDMATHSLDAMARGGIYDHLGGGFSRYSVDRQWMIPHFEKMLYDNALLVPAYLEAFQLTKQDQFAEIARGVLDYLHRDLCSNEGAFFAAEDAGEVGREGDFYVWRYDQLRELLSDDELTALERVSLISANGNFEGAANVIALRAETPWEAMTSGPVLSALNKLRLARLERTRPRRDIKIITSWNGMLITALAKASFILRDQSYTVSAKNALGFIRRELFKSDQLLRSYTSGISAHLACLEDYAALIEGALTLYQLTGDDDLLEFGRQLQTLQDEHFWVESRGLYRFSIAIELPIEQFDRVDGATPSGNSIALKNLAVLNLLLPGDGYSIRLAKLSVAMSGIAGNYPHAVCRALEGFEFELAKPLLVALPKAAPEFADAIIHLLSERYVSAMVFSWTRSTQAHICHGTVCSQLFEDPKQFIEYFDREVPKRLL